MHVDVRCSQAGGLGGSGGGGGGGEEEDALQVKGSYGTKVGATAADLLACRGVVWWVAAASAADPPCRTMACNQCASTTHTRAAFIPPCTPHAAGGSGAAPAVADAARRHRPRARLLHLEGRAGADQVGTNCNDKESLV